MFYLDVWPPLPEHDRAVRQTADLYVLTAAQEMNIMSENSEKCVRLLALLHADVCYTVPLFFLMNGRFTTLVGLFSVEGMLDVSICLS